MQREVLLSLIFTPLADIFLMPAVFRLPLITIDLLRYFD